MRDFSVTLKNAEGPYFLVSADDFEITHNSYTHKPQCIVFGRNTENGGEIVCTVEYRYVHEIADVTDGEYNKIDFKES